MGGSSPSRDRVLDREGWSIRVITKRPSRAKPSSFASRSSLFSNSVHDLTFSDSVSLDLSLVQAYPVLLCYVVCLVTSESPLAERDALKDLPNVYSYRAFMETDKAGYIHAPIFKSTREEMDRVLADQRHAGHTKAQPQISHGDIKCENILVTTWNWVYLTDFASYKPTYLPLDDPADFLFFFDTSGRRTCYIAPERFYTAGSEMSKLKAKLDFHERDGKVTETMDVFSLGSVIAELFLEGAAMFTLSQLFKYRSEELSIEAHLAAIDDAEIRALILRMVAPEPTERPTFDTLLHEYRGNVFPEHFYSFLYDYIGSMNELSTATIFNKPSPLLPVSAASEMPGMAETTSLSSDSDHRIEKIWTEYEAIEPHFTEQGDNAELERQ
ncbi:hypothetical protein M422DRAFT_263730 [Sphaerobolus stellatus SS14]|uniref:Protein kinase domain-containing protein n=1 Tax=Sphaerobolus stellatus (strain SS14) TaxID=990650 RepID=A0A0C9VA69_SPHS4|nr:hypothetical protein M422DRAFT_263730 [Sphaerobolus stellatus SS14]